MEGGPQEQQLQLFVVVVVVVVVAVPHPSPSHQHLVGAATARPANSEFHEPSEPGPGEAG